MAPSSPRTWKRPRKSPASMTHGADTLLLSNGKDVVSQPVRACILLLFHKLVPPHPKHKQHEHVGIVAEHLTQLSLIVLVLQNYISAWKRTVGSYVVVCRAHSSAPHPLVVLG